MDILEARKKIAEIGFQVNRYLPEGWSIKIDTDNDDRVTYQNGPLEFSISLDWREYKLKVDTWKWPTYSSLERGEPKHTTIWPRDLYDPKEETPSIGIGAAKKPEQIAADITRRFIGDYERIYKRCQERADGYQAHEDKSRSQWLKVCELLGTDPKYDTSYRCEIIGGLVMGNRNGSLHVEGYISFEVLSGLVEMFSTLHYKALEKVSS